MMKERAINDLFSLIFDLIERNNTTTEKETIVTVPTESYFKDEGESYVLKLKTCNVIDNRHVEVEYEDSTNSVTIKVRYSYKKKVDPYSDYCATTFDWWLTKPLPKDAVPETLTAEVKNGVVTIAVKKRTPLCIDGEEQSTTIKIKRLKS